MNSQNRYCCRCLCTTRFKVDGRTFTCTRCGVIVEKKETARERTLVGNPFRSYKTNAA